MADPPKGSTSPIANSFKRGLHGKHPPPQTGPQMFQFLGKRGLGPKSPFLKRGSKAPPRAKEMRAFGPLVGGGATILTQIMADEFNFLWSEIQHYIAEADADIIPVPGQLELHGRYRYGVLLSSCFGVSICRRSNCGDGRIRIALLMQRQI